MGYWKVDAVYRGKADCSVPSEKVELRFATKPIIAFATYTGCGCKTYHFSVPSTNLAVISNSSAWYHSIGSPVYVPDDNTENTPHDCINGVCVPAGVYSSPGKYATKAACQSACGSSPPPDYCPPNMVCIPTEKYSLIESLSIALENSACQ
jgi:hypothetical protein